VFLLGHAGIGPRLLGSLRQRLPPKWLVLGCLLPDLIDKPLFYVLLWAHGHADPVISGSRSIGHTGLFLLLLFLVALIARRPWSWALFAGVATHLALDIGGELITGADAESSIWLAILYPLYGRFPLAHFGSLFEHLWLSARNVYVVAGELIGGAILLSEWLAVRRRRQSS
jgi:hypothetical protein